MNHLKLYVLAGTLLVLFYSPGPSEAQDPPASPSTVTIEGTVTRVWFRNPSVRYLIAVPNGSGRDDEVWDVRGSPVESLAPKGWVADTIQVGDTVSVYGQRRRDGVNALYILNVTLADGTLLVDRTLE
ncbi:MAG: DUF6152 family protein [Pseudomonadota bacterium]